MPEIFYLCHDISRPAGGVRTIYLHVDHLLEEGFKASVAHFTPGFNIEWFPSKVPIIDASKGLQLTSEDWVVFPEDLFKTLEAFRDVNCHKAILCQNHFYIFDAMPVHRRWSDYGVEKVLVTSSEIKKYVQRVFGIEGVYIPYAIDHKLFSPNSGKRHFQIAYMPRKGWWNIQQARGMLWHRRPDLREIPWVPIDGISEDQVAKIFQQSTFFLSTSYREGFGLPPVEAMACGCIVIGFTGGGGREYATRRNGFWVEDEDSIGMAKTLERVLGDFHANPEKPAWEDIRKEAYKTAKAYSVNRQKALLSDFWRRVLKGS
jgi:glycosyltransferase involved in cell wall biosynthesis